MIKFSIACSEAFNIQRDQTGLKFNYAKRFDSNRYLFVKILMKNKKHAIDIKAKIMELYTDIVDSDYLNSKD